MKPLTDNQLLQRFKDNNNLNDPDSREYNELIRKSWAYSLYVLRIRFDEFKQTFSLNDNQ